ncbi:MAG: tripartite tricarboxylate transporter substrate-binding protein [Caldimonas sp.]
MATLERQWSSSFTIVPALRDKLSFDVTRDLLPIALVTYAPLVVVTSPSKPCQRLVDVISAAKATPRKLTFSTCGPGSQPHLAAELLADAAAVQLEAVPYKGSADAPIGLMRGDVDIGVETVSAAAAQIQAGKLRALAVTTAKRSPFLPQVPGFDELGLSGARAQASRGSTRSPLRPERQRQWFSGWPAKSATSWPHRRRRLSATSFRSRR